MSELVLTPRRTRVAVHELTEDGLVLEVGGAVVPTGCWPDDRSARRLARLATRVVDVELRVDGPEPSGFTARVTGVWHRMPHTRPVPVAAALALLRSGVPTFLVGRVPVSGGVPR